MSSWSGQRELYRLWPPPPLLLPLPHTSSFLYGPYSLTNISFRMIAPTDLSCAFFVHLLLPIHFKSFSIQLNHLSFDLPALLLPSDFPRNTFFTDPSSEVLKRWPADSSRHF
jgi:hypothetical protein